MTEASIIAAHRQDDSKVDAITKFDTRQSKALDQKTFLDILAEVSAHSKADSEILILVRLYTGIRIYRPSIARA